MSDDMFSVSEPRWDDPALADACDELSLWSAPFGLALLEAVALRPGITALDVGCGTGFPAIELAQRLGPSATVHAVDVCGAALARARKKLEASGVRNVVLHEAPAESLPLPDGSIDLIVSNNGFNNVADVEAVLAECARVARPGAQLVYAYNLPGSMLELYGAYDAVLADRGMESERRALAAHIREKRKPLEETTALLGSAGFGVIGVVEGSFRLRFSDAAALFAHAFMRLAFVPGWLGILEPSVRKPIFGEIERRLDAGACAAGGIALTIPFACCDCRRD
jgi:arsenite methyltransferase